MPGALEIVLVIAFGVIVGVGVYAVFEPPAEERE